MTQTTVGALPWPRAGQLTQWHYSKSSFSAFQRWEAVAVIRDTVLLLWFETCGSICACVCVFVLIYRKCGPPCCRVHCLDKLVKMCAGEPGLCVPTQEQPKMLRRMFSSECDVPSVAARTSCSSVCIYPSEWGVGDPLPIHLNCALV